MRDFGERHGAFRREASELFAKWEDRAAWKPFLHPTVNVNSFMSDGASLTARRTIIPRTAHARLDIRVTPDTPPAAMLEIVERVVAEHRDRTPGITFTVRTAAQPASYTSPTRLAMVLTSCGVRFCASSTMKMTLAKLRPRM